MSQTIATTRSKKRTSARNIKVVDVGVLSFAKTQLTHTQTSDRIQPGSPNADRVFVCDAVTAGPSVHASTDSGRPVADRWTDLLRRVLRHPFWCAWRTDGWSRVRPRQFLHWAVVKPRKTVLYH